MYRKPWKIGQANFHVYFVLIRNENVELFYFSSETKSTVTEGDKEMTKDCDLMNPQEKERH